MIQETENSIAIGRNREPENPSRERYMSFKAVISGEQTGVAATLVRGALRGMAWLYGCIIFIRNLLYDWKLLKATRLEVPVICVGNITVGGTGKTPMVIWLCRYLQSRGKKPAILCRGYKASSGEANDEVSLLREKLPEVPVEVNPDRIQGGQAALEKYHPDVLVLDDGFQHRRLYRNLDIVMIDCINPFGYHAILPRGLLRESVKQLQRAGALVLSHCDYLAESELKRLVEKLEILLNGPASRMDSPLVQPRHKPIISCRNKPIVLSRHKPVVLCRRLADSSEQKQDIAALPGRRVFAFCGIGNPRSFITALENTGAQIVGKMFFADHINYSQKEIEQLARKRAENDFDWYVTTEKDWVKLRELSAVEKLGEVYRLQIAIALTDGKEQFSQRIDAIWTKTQQKNIPQ